jgi:hypothetical protein
VTRLRALEQGCKKPSASDDASDNVIEVLSLCCFYFNLIEEGSFILDHLFLLLLHFSNEIQHQTLAHDDFFNCNIQNIS